MPLVFYPHPEDAQKGSFEDRIEILMEAAERYKALVLDSTLIKVEAPEEAAKKRITPKDMVAAFNWEEIALILRQIRELPEGNQSDKIKKGTLLRKLSNVYEVLRGAKMSKLEAVRLALVSEANQLLGGALA